jgi:hypothetical protein
MINSSLPVFILMYIICNFICQNVLAFKFKILTPKDDQFGRNMLCINQKSHLQSF